MGNLLWEDKTYYQMGCTTKKNPRLFYIEGTLNIFMTENHMHEHLP